MIDGMMPGVEISIDHSESDSESSDKEKQLEKILSENLRMIPDQSNEVDKMGTYLCVDPEDDNPLHIQEHKAFIAANTLRPQYKSMMNIHITKHEIAEKEKERMGLNKIESGENSQSQSTSTSEDY